MHIVTIIDSFKGSVNSIDAGTAIKNGLFLYDKNIIVDVIPLADGGEGTVDALSFGLNGRLIKSNVTGPTGNVINATYCVIESKKLAVIEMAQASGLNLVPKDKRKPMYTTTYGVGELICDAIDKGCTHFIIGIGGSATNDGGVGMLQALGYEFLDKNGESISFGAIGLKDLVSIRTENVNPKLKDCKFTIACDVTNPLLGENGCSRIFGPQKGATPDDILLMDEYLKNYSQIVYKQISHLSPNTLGAGAAGGLGFAFLAFLNSKLESGAKIVSEILKYDEKIAKANLVITGEGSIDKQTFMGKGPAYVASICKRYGVTVVALAGQVDKDISYSKDNPFDAVFSIQSKCTTLDESIKKENTIENLKSIAVQIVKLCRAARK